MNIFGENWKPLNAILSRLDQKYLICELLDKPETALEEAYSRVLRAACKSMTEEVSAQRTISRSYKEYMEEWVHEVKTPITAMISSVPNHSFPESARIGRELAQIRYLVEQVLYYARSEQVEKDYFIKKLRICDVLQPALLQCRTLLLEAGISLQIEDWNRRSSAMKNGCFYLSSDSAQFHSVSGEKQSPNSDLQSNPCPILSA